MSADDPLTLYRGKLLGLAYRMLGSRADAEDVLQDAYLRFAAAQDVRNSEGFLVTIVTRLCLDRLKSARATREVYVGQWLPEPVIDAEALSPQVQTELADDLSFALLLALERLTPGERAAFILHDVFDVPFDAVAETLGKSDAACRQLAARARTALHDTRRTTAPSQEKHGRLLMAFLNAAATGDIAALTAMLREDAIAIADGGGAKLAALNIIRGADKVARYFMGSARKAGAAERRSELCSINGAPGLLVFQNGALELTLSIAADGDRIAALYVVRNPAKLTALAGVSR